MANPVAFISIQSTSRSPSQRSINSKQNVSHYEVATKSSHSLLHHTSFLVTSLYNPYPGAQKYRTADRRPLARRLSGEPLGPCTRCDICARAQEYYKIPLKLQAERERAGATESTAA